MATGDPTLASDAERAQAVDLLKAAHVEGRLDAEEVAQRIEAALRARTRGDLAALTTDLPSGAAPGQVVPVPEPALPATRESGNATAAWAAWGIASSVTFVIWLIIFITSGASYPWFLWVAGPWGAVLLVKTLTGGFRDDG